MDRVIFVYSAIGIGRLLGEEGTIVSLSPEVDFYLEGKRIPFKRITDFGIKPIPYRDLFLKHHRLYKEWGKLKIGGKRLVDLLTFRGISLWDAVDVDLWEADADYILVYSMVISRIVALTRPREIVAQEMSKIYFASRDRLFFHDILKGISERSGIRFRSIRVQGHLARYAQGFLDYGLNAYLSLKRISRKRKTEKRYDILFFLFGGGQDKIIPIQEELRKRGMTSLIVYSEGLRKASLRTEYDDKGWDYVFYEAYADGDGKASFFRRIWGVFRPLPLLFNGIDLRRALHPKFRHLFLHRFPELVRMAGAFEKIMGSTKPKLVVTNNETLSFGYTAVRVARRKKIPSLMLQHATNLEYKVRVEPSSDFFSLWTRYDKVDVDEKRICITGSSKQDFMKREFDSFDKGKILEELGIPEGKKVILFASRHPVARDMMRIRDLIAAMDEGMVSIIKMHPGETDFTPAGLAGIFSDDRLFFHKSMPFIRLLSVADVVLSNEDRTTCSDAIMVGKPVITLWYDHSFDQALTEMTEYGENPPLLRAHDAQELKRHIACVLYDLPFRSVLVKRLEEYNKDIMRPGSTGRIVDFMSRIIEKGN